MQIIADSPDHEILEEAISILGLADELSSLATLEQDGIGLDDGPELNHGLSLRQPMKLLNFLQKKWVGRT